VSEKTIDQEAVRQEHLADVDQARQWAILGGVFGFSTLLMLGLIALLGG
jgi:hypothetical protein